MSDFLVYIKLPAYEREWCHHHFGDPCRFPSQSNVNNVIRHFIKLRPDNCIPEGRKPDEIAVCIPSSKSKQPSSYNFLTKSGKEAIAEAINDIFIIDMWESLTNTGTRNVSVRKLVSDWMEGNGISSENFDNLRQKFIRICDSYRKNSGLNLTRGYKHEHTRKKREKYDDF